MRVPSMVVVLVTLLKPSPLNGLPPELKDVSVAYLETLDQYVPYPDSALKLLETEVHHLAKSVNLTITTSASHWHNPLWHLFRGLVRRLGFQNQVLSLISYGYVGDGKQQKCRVSQLNEATGEEIGMPVSQDEYCQSSCTNGGRYCAAELPEDIRATITGKMIVEETLRRLCFNDIYHAVEYKFWDYLDAFEALECWSLHDDMGECATKALEHTLPSAPEVIQACMAESGGLEDDKENTKLQAQLDWQAERDYFFEQIPVLEINNKEYQGIYNIESIFQQICQTYSDTNDNVQPIACDFCQNCDDVRHCLWYLECDGSSFDPDTYTSSWWPDTGEISPSNQPEAVNDVTSTSQADNAQNNDGPEMDNDRFLYVGVVTGLLLGILPAVYFAKRASRTRAILHSALATRAAAGLEEGTFVDNLAVSTGRGRPSPEELKDLDDVDIEIRQISSMMVENGGPPQLAFLPHMT